MLENDEDEGMSKQEVQLHLESTKVRIIEKLYLGDFAIDTWYYCPLPAEY